MGGMFIQGSNVTNEPTNYNLSDASCSFKFSPYQKTEDLFNAFESYFSKRDLANSIKLISRTISHYRKNRNASINYLKEANYSGDRKSFFLRYIN